MSDNYSGEVDATSEERLPADYQEYLDGESDELQPSNEETDGE